ncbi:MAG: orotidine 5'-phosphate decarboxylase / HUMPS family protein [Anaerolineae bacterium]
MLDASIRYLQLAINEDLRTARLLLRAIPPSPRIFVEAGTPLIKREGMAAVKEIRRLWKGGIVADMKTADGAVDEVHMAREAGATAVTVLGNSPVETLDLFIDACRRLGVYSMVDMLGVADPLTVIRDLKGPPPDVVVLHRGRDEEATRGKVIQYRHVKRLLSKYDVSIAAAGGVDLREARSAIFNGANIVVVNIVPPDAPWQGIRSNEDVGEVARLFLRTIE